MIVLVPYKARTVLLAGGLTASEGVPYFIAL